MPKKPAKIIEDEEEEYDNIEVLEDEQDNHEKLEEMNQKHPQEKKSEPIIISKKTGKTMLSEDERQRIRLANLAKAHEAKKQKGDMSKDLKQTMMELKKISILKKKEDIEEMKRLIAKYKDMDKKKHDESEKVETCVKPKKKGKIIVQEEDDEDESEEEEVIIKRKAPKQKTQDYGALIKQNAIDKIKKDLENERLKMAMLSIMPNYKF